MSDFLLGGRVRHVQGTDGHRTGIEPVLLAAFVPARPGQRVLEGGTGSGAALLCLAERVPRIGGVGVEREPAQAALARANFAANGRDRLDVIEADLTSVTLEGRFDHALANPPWHAPAATASPDLAQDLARRARPGLFTSWARALAAPLRHRGTLSFITSAATIPACLEGFATAGCGSVTLLPLWPRDGRPAKLVLLRCVKGGRGPARLLPGLVLHAAEGGYTEATHAVLYDGTAMPE